MRPSTTVGASLALAAAISVPLTSAIGTSHSHEFRHLPLSRRGEPTTPNGISESGEAFEGQTFDYVIVGGGTAGLAVASRLSENSTATVAVIEAGISGMDDPSLLTPAGMLYNSSEHTIKDWEDKTLPQAGLGGREIYYPRGKVLGGCSAINGMYFVRQPANEQETWASVVANMSSTARKVWGWENMLNAMKKSETFDPPTDEIVQQLQGGVPNGDKIIGFNKSSHGTNGPIHASWPAVEFESVGAWLAAASEEMGIPVNLDPDSGNNKGPFLTNSAINPKDWTRSFSRDGYIDPNLHRPNLHILTNHQATKVVFDNSNPPRAIGVEYAANKDDKRRTVNAKNEVIISAGVVGTPQLLQLSGVGDKSVLDPVGIKQVADVPGVGFHMQDHISGGIMLQPKEGTRQPHIGLTGDPKTDSFANSAVAYVPLSKVTDKDQIVSKISSSIDQWVENYKAPQTVKDGYRAALNELVTNIYPNDSPAIEALFFQGYGAITAQCGLQHPTGQGSVHIVSNNAFDLPAIDPAFFSNEVDKEILRNGCRLAQKIGHSKTLAPYVEKETSPGPDVQTDEQWDEFMIKGFSTEFHPSGSCAMLPLEMGGCVDDRLRVHNTKGLRVVDASVPPVSLSQHLLTMTYGLAEIAADVIAEDNGKPVASGTLSGASPATPSQSQLSQGGHSTSNPSNNNEQHKSSANKLAVAGTALSVVAALAASQLL